MASLSSGLYKQIVLYILHRSKISLAQNTIIDVIVNLGYTDYINAQSAIGDLIRADLVRDLDTYHRSYISLTSSGEETLNEFIDQLSSDIRREIDEYLKENNIETINESVLISDYKLSSSGNYIATCSVREGQDILFSVSLSVPSEDDAIHVCDKWESMSDEIYADTLRKLM